MKVFPNSDMGAAKGPPWQNLDSRELAGGTRLAGAGNSGSGKSHSALGAACLNEVRVGAAIAHRSGKAISSRGGQIRSSGDRRRPPRRPNSRIARPWGPPRHFAFSVFVLNLEGGSRAAEWRRRGRPSWAPCFDADRDQLVRYAVGGGRGPSSLPRPSPARFSDEGTAAVAVALNPPTSCAAVPQAAGLAGVNRHAAAGQAGQKRRRRSFELPDGARTFPSTSTFCRVRPRPSGAWDRRAGRDFSAIWAPPGQLSGCPGPGPSGGPFADHPFGAVRYIRAFPPALKLMPMPEAPENALDPYSSRADGGTRLRAGGASPPAPSLFQPADLRAPLSKGRGPRRHRREEPIFLPRLRRSRTRSGNFEKVLREIPRRPGCGASDPSVLYQDLPRARRIRGVPGEPLTLRPFRRRPGLFRRGRASMRARAAAWSTALSLSEARRTICRACS